VRDREISMAHRRLFNVSQHLGRGAHSKATAGLITTGEEGSETVFQGPKLFDDQQMMDFIREGYVMFRLDDLPRLYHDGIVDKLNRVIEKHGNPGNNMLPMVPELMTMLKHPVVDGALQSILGEPAMHTCCSTSRAAHKAHILVCLPVQEPTITFTYTGMFTTC
jgi:hypothetical protein